jgi:Mannosyltransferase (PIG-V)
MNNFVPFAASRLLLIVACYLCLTLFPVHPILDWQVQVFPNQAWLDGFVRWDAMWYESIVDASATLLPPNHSNANFFPLYSAVSWTVSLPLRPWLDAPRSFYVAGVLVSLVSFLLGLVAVHRIAAKLAGPEVASRTVWLIALFPFSFFFSAVYSDALYLCLAAWSFKFALDGRWTWACTLAAFAATTRIVGLSLYPALLVEYHRQHNFRASTFREESRLWAILAMAPLCIGTYFWIRYGSPVEFIHARQVGWARGAGLTALAGDFREFTAGSIFACGNLKDCLRDWDMTRSLLGYWYLLLIPANVVLALYAVRTLGLGLVVWVLTSVAMALPNGLDGMGRFTSVLFPTFIAAAMLLRRRPAFLLVCAAFVPFLLLFFSQFARWRPVL